MTSTTTVPVDAGGINYPAARTTTTTPSTSQWADWNSDDRPVPFTTTTIRSSKSLVTSLAEQEPSGPSTYLELPEEDPQLFYLTSQVVADSTGGVSTLVQTFRDSYSVYVTSKVVADSTGGVSTIVQTLRDSYSAYITSKVVTDSMGAISTIAETKIGVFVAYITSRVVTDSRGSLSTLMATTTTYYPDYTASESRNQPPSNTSAPFLPDPQRPDEVELGLILTAIKYFRAIYLPTVVAVLLKLLWSIVFASVKMMEPFYLLSGRNGASVKESLISDYLTSSLTINSVHNIANGHPVVILASIACLCLGFLPALAAQCSTMRAIGICQGPNGEAQHCHPMWELSIPFARAIQGVLALVATIIILMMIISARRQSGVFSNPSSIANMASLLHNNEFLSEIRKIEQTSSRSAIGDILDPCRYKLVQYPTISGHVGCTVVKANSARLTTKSKPPNRRRYSKASVPSSSPLYMKQESRSRTVKRYLLDCLFILAMIGLLTIVVAYFFAKGDSWFNNFFNSNPMRRFVVTVIASLLDSRWKQLEREVRLMTPYHRLFQGHANPESTILVTQNATAITSFFPALWKGNFFQAYIAFVATLSDCLVILIGGVPYSPSQFQMDFLICTYASCSILVVMILTVLTIFRWRASIEKMMIPRDPDTLVSVWLMLCNEGNGVCKEMREYEMMGDRARDEKIRANGARYWGGWATEPNGNQRWVIERVADKSQLAQM